MVERVKLFSRAMLETPSDVDEDEGGGVSVVEQEVLGEDEVDPIVSIEIVIMGLCCLKKTPYKMSKLQREKKTIIGPCP